MEWEKIAIGHKSICEINPSDNYQKNKEYLFVPMDAVGDDFAGLKYLDKRIIENGGLVSFREGDTLVAKITPCAENGKIAFIKSLGEDIGFGSTEFIVFRPNTENITSAFLYYLLSSHRIHGLAISLMEGTTGRQRIPVNAYKKRIIVSIPPLPEQKTITAILSKVDEAIAAVDDSIKAAEKVKKALMQNLLTGKLKPDGTWRSDDEFYTDEKFGKIPKGWEIQQLKEIAKIQRGKFAHRPRNEPRFYGGQYPFIQTSDIVNAGIYVNNHLQTLNETGLAISKKFPAKTIAITIAANIGDVAILKYEMCFPDSLIGIIPHSIISSEYLALFLTTQKNLLNQFATESAQKNINYSALRPLQILFPNDSKEQSRIVEILLNIEKTIETKQAKIETLKSLKKSLMQNLLTGKIRVNPSQFSQEISRFS